jgi:hypothetical protein
MLADSEFIHQPPGERAITTPFNDAERERFRNLLELAHSSPYEGERTNALAAAERLAERHGMTLEEAATGRTQGPTETRTQGAPTVSPMRDLARVVHLMDYQIQVDKARIAEAKKQAVERGLETDEKPRKRTPTTRFAGSSPYRSRRRMEPNRHARVLLEETTLPVEEIASITGLDVYKVAGLKLKLRPADGHRRRYG